MKTLGTEKCTTLYINKIIVIIIIIIKIWDGVHLEEEEMEYLVILDAGGYKWNERAGNWRFGMGRQIGVEKED